MWTNTAADHCGVRILLVTALVHRLSLYTCDLASAYLQADAGGREVYIRISRALRGSLPDDIQQQMNAIEYPVVHLRRALYGRKRSGLDWSRKLHSTLMDMGFAKCSSINGIYFHLGDKKEIVCEL